VDDDLTFWVKEFDSVIFGSVREIQPRGGTIVGERRTLIGPSKIICIVKSDGIVRLEPPKGTQISTDSLKKKEDNGFEKMIIVLWKQNIITCNGINCV